MLFLRCDIENPSFDGQTKDYMRTDISNFGSRCEVSDKFIEKVASLGIMETVCAITEIKEHNSAKKHDGVKSRVIHGIPKLVDANWAGTAKSRFCTLIITEGDSAKTAAISGLSPEDRNCYGIYPAKGKPPNVRGMTLKNIIKNEEIDEIKQILGLEIKKEYKTFDDVYKHLRYGKIILMTDQDPDGSHIKGLAINLFQCEWNSLFKLHGFISFINTPILKAKKNNEELKFYNKGEYEEWKNNNDTKGWTIKYYKGLATSTKSEFIDYFKQPKIVNFDYTENTSDDVFDMIFNVKRSGDRKQWLETIYDRNSYLDTRANSISYEDFVNKEFIHFSKYDCDRSIPNIMDGLKISTRKIIYSAFKKNLTYSIKVSQFSGYVSENSVYHHGEESLNKAIIGLAQNYMGSNNINLLAPEGQFGSRVESGKDSGSPRYIFTKLERISRFIYSDKDDEILNYLDDDGTMVEPQFYVPIIPMILVNGTNGIGTGFSSNVLCYNIVDIIAYLKNKLSGRDELNNSIEFMPYYYGFAGTISRLSSGKILFKGSYNEISENEIVVTELPVGMSTQKFVNLLDKLKTDRDEEGKKIVPIIKESSDNSTDTTIHFTITFNGNNMQELKSIEEDHGCNRLEKILKLYTTESTTNMNLFNSQDKLTKYDSVVDVINDYYPVRLEYYQIRKNKLIQNLTKELKILRNKARYIQELLDDTIDLRRKSETEVNEMLQSRGYEVVNDDYNYLLDMKMNSVCNEKNISLQNKYLEKERELNILETTSIENVWLSELEILELEYINYTAQRDENLIAGSEQMKKKEIKKTVKNTKATKATKKNTQANINQEDKVTEVLPSKTAKPKSEAKKTTQAISETKSEIPSEAISEVTSEAKKTTKAKPKESKPKEAKPKESKPKESKPKEAKKTTSKTKETTQQPAIIMEIQEDEYASESDEEDDIIIIL